MPFSFGLGEARHDAKEKASYNVVLSAIVSHVDNREIPLHDETKRVSIVLETRATEEGPGQPHV